MKKPVIENRFRDVKADGFPNNNYPEEPIIPTPDAPREVRKQLTMPSRKEAPAHSNYVDRYHMADKNAMESSVSTKELDANLAKAKLRARELERQKNRSRSRSRDKEAHGGQKLAHRRESRNYDGTYKAHRRQRSRSSEHYKETEQARQERQLPASTLKSNEQPSDKYTTKDENYAKKYELGIASKRPVKPTVTTEYQRQYQEMPQKIRTSAKHDVKEIRLATQIAPPRNTKIPFTTEYQREFQKKQQRISRGLQPAAGVPYRSKSLPRERTTSDNIPSVKVDGHEYKPHQSLNPQKASFPLGRHRTSLQSEYKRSFKDAQDWKSWFSEVVELRKRAEMYKQRSYGTHFSREHLGQLYGNAAEAWNYDSPKSHTQSDDGIAFNRPSTAPVKHQRPVIVSSDEASGKGYESDEENEPSLSERSDNRRSRSLKKREHVTEVDERGRPKSLSPPRLPTNLHDGRQTTPRIRNKQYQRHHFDRTTPNFGSLLVGDPVPYDSQNAGSMKKDDRSEHDSRTGSVKAFGVQKPVTRLLRETENLLNENDVAESTVEQKLTNLRPAGLPTSDPFPLLDETASHDASLVLEDLEEPRRPSQTLPRKRDAKGLRDDASDTSSIRLKRGEPIVREPVRSVSPVGDADFSDGFFSDTASLVSSSTLSLASNTLERAQQRKDGRFWGRL